LISSVGHHGRGLRNRFLEEYLKSGLEPLTWPLLSKKSTAVNSKLFKLVSNHGDGEKRKGISRSFAEALQKRHTIEEDRKR
jgi:hypothetical protein